MGTGHVAAHSCVAFLGHFEENVHHTPMDRKNWLYDYDHRPQRKKEGLVANNKNHRRGFDSILHHSLQALISFFLIQLFFPSIVVP